LHIKKLNLSIKREICRKKKKKGNEILTLFFLPKSLALGPEEIEAVVIDSEIMAETVGFGFEKQRALQKP
jgi:hypothetical protein